MVEVLEQSIKIGVHYTALLGYWNNSYTIQQSGFWAIGGWTERGKDGREPVEEGAMD